MKIRATQPAIRDGVSRGTTNVPMTLVYIPSPAAMYRHTSATIISHDIYLPITDASQIGKEVLVDGRPFPVAAVYANSQKICEKIRNVTVAQGIGFIDTRPTLRAAAARRPLHGPRDWNHLNESGYRVLGTYLAARIEMSSDDLCNDQWGAEDRAVARGGAPLD